MASGGLGSILGSLGSSATANGSTAPFQGDPSTSNPSNSSASSPSPSVISPPIPPFGGGGVDGLPTQTPAATQLLSLSSQINALLQELASAYPITSPYVENVTETLVQGIIEAISSMDTQPSVIGQPQIA